ncbi:UNVERIFIED_CONTAM: hypothetical protein ABIE34_000461 [Jeotgalibacillus campisalis]
MIIDRAQTDTSMTTVTIQIENLSVHPMRGGRLEWLLRDGTSGSHPVGEIRGRLTPFGGMLHRAEGVEDLIAAETFNGGTAGVDRVSLDYWGSSREVTFRTTHAIEWVVLPNQWSEVDGVLIPSTSRIRNDRADVEL